MNEWAKQNAGFTMLELVVVMIILGILAAVGARGSSGWGRGVSDRTGVVMRLQFWTLVTGCGLYGLTSGVVYDRYLVSWAVLMPIVWVVSLPRRALGLQAALLLTLLCWSVWRLLIRV